MANRGKIKYWCGFDTVDTTKIKCSGPYFFFIFLIFWYALRQDLIWPTRCEFPNSSLPKYVFRIWKKIRYVYLAKACLRLVRCSFRSLLSSGAVCHLGQPLNDPGGHQVESLNDSDLLQYFFVTFTSFVFTKLARDSLKGSLEPPKIKSGYRLQQAKSG